MRDVPLLSPRSGRPGRLQLQRWQDLIEGYAKGHGLDFFETIFGGMGRGQAQTGGFPGFTTAPQSQLGQDVAYEVEISLTEAHQGTTRLVEIDGRRLDVKIPAGAETGTRVRVRGQGQNGIASGSVAISFFASRLSPTRALKERAITCTAPYRQISMRLSSAVRFACRR